MHEFGPQEKSLNLTINSSFGFGSKYKNCCTFFANSISLRLLNIKLAFVFYSLVHDAKGTLSPKKAPTVKMHLISRSFQNKAEKTNL